MNNNIINQQNTVRLNPEKLFVQFRPGTTPTAPILKRRYTLTHSDITADLFLSIALQYAWDKITPMRDEVLAQWGRDADHYYLYGYVHVDGSLQSKNTAIRDRIFRKELPLALEAIRYGDRFLFQAHPDLDYAPIWIWFQSVHPQYNKWEYWGVAGDYALVM